MALVQFYHESRYLKGNQQVWIILPDLAKDKTPKEFYGSGKKYKVLWLLHGTFGDASDWVRKSNVELYAIERDLIVVMPSALNSNYSNWDGYMMGYSMFDYLLEELMPIVYGWFPASNKREDNFIAGLSMGARGCIKYAVNFPEKFAGAAALSQIPTNLSNMTEEDFQGDDPFASRLRTSVINAGGLEKYVNSEENTWKIVDMLAGTGKLPKLFFACGKEDMLYQNYTNFKAHAKEIGLDAEFLEIEGLKHEWRFWDQALEKALDYFQIEKHEVSII